MFNLVLSDYVYVWCFLCFFGISGLYKEGFEFC